MRRKKQNSSEALHDALSEGVVTAISAVMDIAGDSKAQHADRLRASNMLLSMAGLLNGDTRKSEADALASATTDELKEMLQTAKAQRGLSALND